MYTDATLIIGELDLTGKTLTYSVQKEVSYPRVVTTIDGTEYAIRQDRDVISFSLMPLTDAQTEELYEELSKNVLETTYTSSFANADVTGDCRLISNLDSIFGLRSIDGNRYYKGGTITLRRRKP